MLKPTGTFWLNLGDTYCGSGGKGSQYEKFMPKKGQPAHYKQRIDFKLPARLRSDESTGFKPDKKGWLQPKQKLMIPARVAIALQHDGWILRNDNIWWKPNAMPSSVKDRLTNAYEHVFFFAKQRRYYFDLDAIRVPQKSIMEKHEGASLYRDGHPSSWSTNRRELNPKGKNPGDVLSGSKYLELSNAHSLRIRGGHTGDYTHPRGKNPGDLWQIPTIPFPGAHFATFPPKLIEPIIKAGSPKGGVVLDPFGGSGTVGQVARKLGRRFILIEIIPEYCKMAEQRVRGKYKPVPEGVTTFTNMEAENA